MKKIVENNAKEIIELLNENRFFSFFNRFVIIRLNKRFLCLNNSSLDELFELSVDKLSVDKLRKRKKGMTAKKFLKEHGENVLGYRIFDSEKRKDHIEGRLVKDDTKHGIYFTIEKSEIFRFVLTNGAEKYGNSLAVISFRNKYKWPIRGAHIAKGGDTRGTYRSRIFVVKETMLLDDYGLIMKLYDEADDEFKNLIKYDYFFEIAVAYYRTKEMNEVVRALIDIRKQY